MQPVIHGLNIKHLNKPESSVQTFEERPTRRLEDMSFKEAKETLSVHNSDQDAVLNKPEKIQFQISASTHNDRYFMNLSPQKIINKCSEEGSF